MMQDSEGNVFFQGIFKSNIGITPDGRIITDYVEDKYSNRLAGRKIINRFGQSLEIKKYANDPDETIFLLNNGTAVYNTNKRNDEYLDGHDLDCDTLKITKSSPGNSYQMAFCHLIYDVFDCDSNIWDYDSGPFVNSGLIYPKLSAYTSNRDSFFGEHYDTYITRIYCFGDNEICNANDIFKFTQYMGHTSDKLPKIRVEKTQVYSFQNYLISNMPIELIDSPNYIMNCIHEDKIIVYEIKNKCKLIKAALHHI